MNPIVQDIITSFGSFYGSGAYLRSDMLCTSVSVEYIPIICCDMNSGMTFSSEIRDIGDNIHRYYKPSGLPGYTSMPDRIEYILDTLREKNGFRELKMTDSEATLNIGKGMIFSQDRKILMALCLHKSKAVQYWQGADSSSNMTYEDFVLYLSPELMYSPVYAKFYKRLHKAYIQLVIEKGIEIRVMAPDKIEKNTFTNEFKLQYNHLSELEHHLQNEVGKLLSLSDRDFMNINPGLDIPPLSDSDLMDIDFRVRLASRQGELTRREERIRLEVQQEQLTTQQIDTLSGYVEHGHRVSEFLRGSTLTEMIAGSDSYLTHSTPVRATVPNIVVVDDTEDLPW